MRVIYEVMTRREAAATRRPELLNGAECVIIERQNYSDDGRTHYWAHPFGTGTTPDLERAAVFNIAGAISHIYQDGEQRVGFIKAEPPPPGPDGKVRRNMAKLVLGSSLHAMLEASPNNPTVRAHVMAKTGRMPADELDTFQKIVDWIECDLDLPGSTPLLKPATTVAAFDWTAPATNAAPAPPLPAFTVTTRNSEQKVGKCFYSQTNTSRSTVPITRAQIMDLVSDDMSLDEIVDAIAQDVEERASEYERDEVSGERDHDDYEHLVTEDREVTFDRRDLTNQLAAYLRTQLSREELDSLDL